jgi:DNA-binding beta-propeller fold protein YncE
MRTLALALSALCAAALGGCSKHLRCPSGETDCAGRCVSLLADARNCGSCGNAATPLQVCRGGVLGCAPGVASCGGACTDLSRDPLSCGACGAACGAGEYCTTAGSSSSCTAACAEGLTACAGACVDLASDRIDCGACGHSCLAGQTCRAGACGADLEVACYASGDVRPVAADLQPAGQARLAQGSPTSLVLGAAALYSGNGYPGGVTVFPLDARLLTRVSALFGNDIEDLGAYGGAVLVVNAAADELAVLDAGGEVLDAFALPGTAPNPHGVAVAGSTAYVSLYGDGPDGFGGRADTTGQALARVDLSALPACVAGTASSCGALAGTIDLMAVEGTHDAAGYPFPSKVMARGSKVYVTLANLARADCGGGIFGYCQPAGHGKLAVVDTAADDAVTVVDLGPDCLNPGELDFDGDTAWVACGSFTFRADAPGSVVPVDLSGPSPVVGARVDASAIVPGGLALCGGKGYVTDQASGTVLRFDPATGLVDASETVCPTVYFAWAADVACPRQ